jgi:hypothetical protein
MDNAAYRDERQQRNAMSDCSETDFAGRNDTHLLFPPLALLAPRKRWRIQVNRSARWSLQYAE